MANLNQQTSIDGISGSSRIISSDKVQNSVYRSGRESATLVKFEGLPIRDEISGAICSIRGTSNPTFATGVSGRAIKLRPSSGVDIPVSFNARSRFSIGFWMRPVWLPPVLSLNSNEFNYYRLPIINASNVSLNNVSNIYEASTGFNIFEECIDENQNRIYIFLDGSSGSVLLRSSTSYSVGDFHHFYIAYSGAAKSVLLYIDGKRIETSVVEGTEVPQLLSRDNFTSRMLRINDAAPGFSGLIRKNFSIMDELYFHNEYQGSSELVARHINMGSEFVAFADLLNQDQSNMMFGFDDPSSLDVRSVFSNGTNVYAGRSDGRVYKGDRLLWQSRRDFSNREEINFVRTNLLASEASVSVEGGALRINKASVRL